MHIMLKNLRLILFFIFFVIKSFKKILMRHFAIGSIVVYCTTIIPNTLNKVVDYIKLRIGKCWSTKLEVDKPVLFKCYF